MTKRDNSIGPETGHDELEIPKELPKMVPPANRVTPKVEATAPPKKELDFAEVVALRLSGIDAAQAEQGRKVNEMYGLLVGISMPTVAPLRKDEDGKTGGLGMTFHDVFNELTAIKGTGDAVFERLGDYAKQLADYAKQVQQLLGTEVVALHESNRVLLGKVETLEHQVALLEEEAHPGPNGSHGPATEKE